jgi:excisionase family DNA binding protein
MASSGNPDQELLGRLGSQVSDVSRGFVKRLAREIARELARLLKFPERYLNKREAAQYLGISVSALEKRMGDIPHFCIGRKPVFNRAELDAWMEHNRAVQPDLQQVVGEVIRKINKEK